MQPISMKHFLDFEVNTHLKRALQFDFIRRAYENDHFNDFEMLLSKEEEDFKGPNWWLQIENIYNEGNIELSPLEIDWLFLFSIAIDYSLDNNKRKEMIQELFGKTIDGTFLTTEDKPYYLFFFYICSYVEQEQLQTFFRDVFANINFIQPEKAFFKLLEQASEIYAEDQKGLLKVMNDLWKSWPCENHESCIFYFLMQASFNFKTTIFSVNPSFQDLCLSSENHLDQFLQKLMEKKSVSFPIPFQGYVRELFLQKILNYPENPNILNILFLLKQMDWISLEKYLLDTEIKSTFGSSKISQISVKWLKILFEKISQQDDFPKEFQKILMHLLRWVEINHSWRDLFSTFAVENLNLNLLVHLFKIQNMSEFFLFTIIEKLLLKPYYLLKLFERLFKTSEILFNHNDIITKIYKRYRHPIDKLLFEQLQFDLYFIFLLKTYSMTERRGCLENAFYFQGKDFFIQGVISAIRPKNFYSKVYQEILIIEMGSLLDHEPKILKKIKKEKSILKKLLSKDQEVRQQEKNHLKELFHFKNHSNIYFNDRLKKILLLEEISNKDKRRFIDFVYFHKNLQKDHILEFYEFLLKSFESTLYIHLWNCLNKDLRGINEKNHEFLATFALKTIQECLRNKRFDFTVFSAIENIFEVFSDNQRTKLCQKVFELEGSYQFFYTYIDLLFSSVKQSFTYKCQLISDGLKITLVDKCEYLALSLKNLIQEPQIFHNFKRKELKKLYESFLESPEEWNKFFQEISQQYSSQEILILLFDEKKGLLNYGINLIQKVEKINLTAILTWKKGIFESKLSHSEKFLYMQNFYDLLFHAKKELKLTQAEIKQLKIWFETSANELKLTSSNLSLVQTINPQNLIKIFHKTFKNTLESSSLAYQYSLDFLITFKTMMQKGKLPSDSFQKICPAARKKQLVKKISIDLLSFFYNFHYPSHFLDWLNEEIPDWPIHLSDQMKIKIQSWDLEDNSYRIQLAQMFRVLKKYLPDFEDWLEQLMEEIPINQQLFLIKLFD